MVAAAGWIPREKRVVAWARLVMNISGLSAGLFSRARRKSGIHDILSS